MTVDHVYHAFEFSGINLVEFVEIEGHIYFHFFRSIKDHVQSFGGNFFDRRSKSELVFISDGADLLEYKVVAYVSQWKYATFVDTFRSIGNDHVPVDLIHEPKSAAMRTGAIR